jgi:2-hydroxycyclohexanecarboxyl-CoA dehydrogenase
MSVNLMGVAVAIRHVLPHMLGRGFGRIINTASQLAHKPSPGNAMYCASKAAVVALTASVAQEVADKGVTVNAVCPGPTDTNLLDLVRSGPKGDKIIDAMTRAIPLGRIGRPEDIAGAIAFFLSDDAAYVTGQVLSVSGGLTMAG